MESHESPTKQGKIMNRKDELPIYMMGNGLISNGSSSNQPFFCTEEIEIENEILKSPMSSALGSNQKGFTRNSGYFGSERQIRQPFADSSNLRSPSPKKPVDGLDY